MLKLEITSVLFFVGLLVKTSNVDKYLAKPGTIKPHTKFQAQVYVLSKEEGGRHTPFFSNYRPQFYFRTTDVTGVIHFQKALKWLCLAIILK